MNFCISMTVGFCDLVLLIFGFLVMLVDIVLSFTPLAVKTVLTATKDFLYVNYFLTHQ